MRIGDKRRRGRGESVKVLPQFLDAVDTNGVWWRRSVETDGTWATPENMGKVQRPEALGFKKP